jgi:hypothetical protein
MSPVTDIGYAAAKQRRYRKRLMAREMSARDAASVREVLVLVHARAALGSASH